MSIEIRRFRDSDAEGISTIICRNLREVNGKDYPAEVITKLLGSFTPEKISKVSRQREMFVAETDGVVVGTASLARDNRTTDVRYVCLTVFVLPERHGNGIGKMLMDRVEEAARRNGAATLQVPASITALPFYRKRGYAEDASAPKEAWIWMTKVLGGSKHDTCPTTGGTVRR
jgi:GNAT superfamily N-acetyltransferase